MFKKVAVGDNVEQYENEIKQRMKKKYDQLKQENERNVEMAWQNHLIQNYSSIQQMLQESQYN
jgi:cobalamin biosynthesis Co2+ chelatase CbiK